MSDDRRVWIYGLAGKGIDRPYPPFHRLVEEVIYSLHWAGGDDELNDVDSERGLLALFVIWETPLRFFSNSPYNPPSIVSKVASKSKQRGSN